MAAGLPVTTTREVVELAARGDGPALELVRDAGRTIGTVLAALVNFFNPHRIVMTGGVAQAGAPAAGRHPRGGLPAVACRWPPGRWRSRSATRPTCPGGVGAALMAIEGFLDEDVACTRRSPGSPRPVGPRPAARRSAAGGSWSRCSSASSRFGNRATRP